MNSWSLWATASSKVVQVHREIQQRSPISGSRRPSITSMLSSTIGNTSLIAAQVDFDQILWKLGQIFCFDFVCCFLKRRCEHFKFREGGGKLLKPVLKWGVFVHKESQGHCGKCEKKSRTKKKSFDRQDDRRAGCVHVLVGAGQLWGEKKERRGGQGGAGGEDWEGGEGVRPLAQLISSSIFKFVSQ